MRPRLTNFGNNIGVEQISVLNDQRLIAEKVRSGRY
jgi:hypothetical protein